MLSCAASESELVSAAAKYRKHTKGKNTGRRSRYRGVTRNGGSWQVLMTIQKKKKYIGACRTEEEAGRLFDKYALLIYGLSVRSSVGG